MLEGAIIGEAKQAGIFQTTKNLGFQTKALGFILEALGSHCSIF